MRCTTLFMVSCVFIFYILSHGKDGDARDTDCWDYITFPEGKCGFHGNKKCFEDMRSKNKTIRYRQCKCTITGFWGHQHGCYCRRADPSNCL
ncbi:hypothetical protein BRARA_E02521 [Brassica rapa]|uniref:Uncharacterized protein n=4 Tax=Brassica TaxID=3705 RepID=A0A397ZJL4_BRACM|nr:putative defensin-like protein 233 [Brassica napus]RID63520.1 hypothetical protein BRARA_E02521 [Brassica rapa]VDD46219.1 unnamed protein product [Brassica oleracea]CAF1934024.1 unnamed protein product [Brassica napus]CAF2101084.1 unnamed protein product [Brassica napus]CAG7877410.1 unnamed protein product [Brassica rapa]